MAHDHDHDHGDDAVDVVTAVDDAVEAVADAVETTATPETENN